MLSEVCKDTAGSSDPGLSYPFKLSCVAYHMTALVHAQNCRIDKDGQPYIPLSMWSTSAANLNMRLRSVRLDIRLSGAVLGSIVRADPSLSGAVCQAFAMNPEVF